MYEIQLFLATGTASDDNQFGYPAGERHALLIFSREVAGSQSNWSSAETQALEGGWFDLELQMASVVDPATLDQTDGGRASYEHALVHGAAIIVYSDALT